MISDDVLAGRLPRLGSITTGRGIEATSQAGNAYARPHRSDTLVLHTDDGEVANAVQMRFGGDVLSDSPNWQYDVVTDVRDIELLVLPAGWRQALESWRTAKIERRCDGVQTSMVNGRPDRRACLCAPEMESGQERRCAPHTILPALVDLDVDRWGVWEIRSTGWGSASNLKGSVRALAMIGITSGSVPAHLSMVDRTTRDHTDTVREVTDLALTIAQSQSDLTALAGKASGNPHTEPASLPTGPAADRLQQMQRWSDLQGRAHRLGLRDTLIGRWRSMFEPGRVVDDLDDTELGRWIDATANLVDEAEQAIRDERAEATKP